MSTYKKIAALLLLPVAALADDEWTITCDLVEKYGITCDGVAPPPVLTAEFPKQNDKQTDGILKDGVVYVRWTMEPGVNRSSVIIHEMVHYLLDQTGLIPVHDSPELRCQSEGYAFDVSNRYLRQNNERSLVQRHWWKLYRDCDSHHAKLAPLTDRVVAANE